METAEGIFECKAKGKFRKERISPLAGDKVIITVNEGMENTIDKIENRKNVLKRPPVANIDCLLIVVSSCEPAPNTFVIDKLTVLAEKNGIEPAIVITKTDLKNADEIKSIYSKTPYRIFEVSNGEENSLDEIKAFLSGKLTAFTGNSGVGKSTLLNRLCPTLLLETGKISDKLGRGRHTTRQAEIFHIGDGLVIDTAGFSSIDFIGNDAILKGDLQLYFPEFQQYLTDCRFTGCAHLSEKGCKICELVSEGKISRSRHENYVALYKEARNIKEWEL